MTVQQKKLSISNQNTMNKEHKDPNGKTCKGKKDPQHPKCWHCDTCPYAKCVEDPQSPSENWEEKTGRLIAEARIRNCRVFSPTK